MQRRLPAVVVCLCGSLLGGLPAQGQLPVSRDPQALTLIGQSLSALTGVAGISGGLQGATLQAAVVSTGGSDVESGSATLETSGYSASNVVLNLGGRQRQEVRNGSTGTWIGPDGQTHQMAIHNTWTPASWFFPALVIQGASTDPGMSMAYVGQESRADA